jgi:integrase
MRVVEFFGKDRPLAAITVPELKAYQVERQRQGMAGDTINREIGTLSLVFQSMNELELVNGNPCKLVKRLSSKEGQREAYVSLADVQRIADACPEWFARMIWASFYSGMRRGEILGLRRSQVNLGRRIIRLGAEDVKENRSKRIPIAMPLIPILQEAMKVTAIGPDLVFLMVDERGVRPPSIEGAKNPFARACHKLNLPRPWPTLHDMRHTFRANCRRSGVDPDVAEAILGHADRVKGVRERYGRISDEELVRGIDQVSWDYGPTEIYVARERGKALEKGNSVVTGKAEKEKNQVATLPLAQ